MLMWIIIISLLAIGLTLLVVELIFIPGTTVVGVLGLVFTAAGIIISYDHFGDKVGAYVLISTSAVTVALLFYSFRSGAWKKFSLKSSIESKVNEGLTDTLGVGDEGTTISTLRPMGKAEFKDKVYEVKTYGGYVEAKQKVRIVEIRRHEIVVEPIIN